MKTIKFDTYKLFFTIGKKEHSKIVAKMMSDEQDEVRKGHLELLAEIEDMVHVFWSRSIVFNYLAIGLAIVAIIGCLVPSPLTIGLCLMASIFCKFLAITNKKAVKSGLFSIAFAKSTLTDDDKFLTTPL